MVNGHVFVIGKTGTGKTTLGGRLFDEHPGPAIFCDVQGARVGDADHEISRIEDVWAILKSSWRDGPHIRWLVEDYRGVDRLIVDLQRAHRPGYLKRQEIPVIALVLDEVHLGAPTWADTRTPVVQVFTRGRQHNLFGIGITQWVSQAARVIRANVTTYYLFAQHPQELEILRSEYRLEIPDPEWIKPRPGVTPGEELNHNYYRYDGRWFKGDQDGHELEISAAGETRPIDAPPETGGSPGQEGSPSPGDLPASGPARPGSPLGP